MFAKIAGVSLALILVFALVGCGTTPDTVTPGTTPPDSGAAGGASGMRLANGLYDMPDGTVQALGTLAYVDLEGGFWAITGAPGQDSGSVIAVIANGADLAGTLRPLQGKTVSAVGKRLDGASIRQAGPEIEVTTIEEVTDTPGAAE